MKTGEQHRGGPRAFFTAWQSLEVLVVENSRIRLTLWLEHGGDLLEFRDKATGVDVLWKNPQVSPPRRCALDQPHGGRSEFYDTFHGGWFVSFPNGFFPADYFGAPLGCHGELQSIPWRASVLEESEERVRVSVTGASVRTPWEMTRELELGRDDCFVRWKVSVRNRGRLRLPAAWLEHPGFGAPFIDGAELITAAKVLLTPPADRPELAQLRAGYRGEWPMALEHPSGRPRDCSRVPAAGSDIEHVVILTGFARGWGQLWSARLGLGFGLRWDETVLPYAWSWAAGRGHDTYPIWGRCHTITLQPSSSPLLPFPELVESNQVLWIDGNAQLETRFAAGFTAACDEQLPLG